MTTPKKAQLVTDLGWSSLLMPSPFGSTFFVMDDENPTSRMPVAAPDDSTVTLTPAAPPPSDPRSAR